MTSINKELKIIQTAKRHVIKINDISAFRPNYKNSYMVSRELVSSPIKHIALFCNEYIPEDFPDGKYITYILAINGVDHEIVPINSSRNGIKVIRTVSVKSNLESVLHISEDIKSAVLTVKFQSPDNSKSPYISNLKILMGDDD